jgi:hypothetical protein
VGERTDGVNRKTVGALVADSDAKKILAGFIFGQTTSSSFFPPIVFSLAQITASVLRL